jgi:hypothetical protein
MKLSKRTKAISWGLCVAAVLTGGWVWISHSGDRGQPMLLPGEPPSDILFEEVKTDVCIFLITGVLTTLFVYYRPSKSEDLCSRPGLKS